MYSILFTESALDDMAHFSKREQTTIFDRLDEQLAFEPNLETRNRKKLRPNRVAEWELRINRDRVFYDVNVGSREVEVKMVGRKKGSKLFVRDKEFQL